MEEIPILDSPGTHAVIDATAFGPSHFGPGRVPVDQLLQQQPPHFHVISRVRHHKICQVAAAPGVLLSAGL